MSTQREQTEKTADRLRDELMVTLRELERRREEALDVRGQFTKHKREVQWAAIGVGLAAAAVVGIVIAQSQYRKRHRRKYLKQALLRAWKHPERLASRASEQPPQSEIARKVLTTVATTVAVQLAKRAVNQAVAEE